MRERSGGSPLYSESLKDVLSTRHNRMGKEFRETTSFVNHNVINATLPIAESNSGALLCHLASLT
ncbi:hypothetical protein BGX31_002534, partial [Mortierella sp. GBA43]